MDKKQTGQVFDLAMHLANKPAVAIALIKELLLVNAELVLRVAASRGMTSDPISFEAGGYKYEVSGEDFEAVQQFTRAGQKVEAIKRLRAVTGMGLKESKDKVEEWELLLHL